MSGPPLLIRERPFTFGNHVLWPITVLSWKSPLPIAWRIGNGISDLRFRLYQAYGWEWI